MPNIAGKLFDIVEDAESKLKKLTEEEWNNSSDPGKWNKKEILGHLIDSAANNHQRFVRAQYGDETAISYNQNAWVELQCYKKAPAKNIIDLWIAYNRQLAYIVSQIPEEKLQAECYVEPGKPLTIENVYNDYLSHILHHLKQVVG